MGNREIVMLLQEIYYRQMALEISNELLKQKGIIPNVDYLELAKQAGKGGIAPEGDELPPTVPVDDDKYLPPDTIKDYGYIYCPDVKLSSATTAGREYFDQAVGNATIATVRFDQNIWDNFGQIPYYPGCTQIQVKTLIFDLNTDGLEAFSNMNNVHVMPNFNFTKQNTIEKIIFTKNHNYKFKNDAEKSSFVFAGMNVLEEMDFSWFDLTNVDGITIQSCPILNHIYGLKEQNLNCTTFRLSGTNIEKIKLPTFNEEKLKNFNFSQNKAITELDMSSVKATLSSLSFQDCENLEHLDLSQIDTSTIKDWRYVFFKCYNLKKIDGVLDFRSATTTGNCANSYVFKEDSNLTGLKVKNIPSNFENWSGLTSGQYEVIG